MKSSRKGDGPALYTRLPMLRAERRMSRKELSGLVEVHSQTIGYIERGEYSPSLELGIKIAAVFNLPVAAMFSLKLFETLGAAAVTGEKSVT